MNTLLQLHNALYTDSWKEVISLHDPAANVLHQLIANTYVRA